jgi:hypothetical protein
MRLAGIWKRKCLVERFLILRVSQLNEVGKNAEMLNPTPMQLSLDDEWEFPVFLFLVACHVCTLPPSLMGLFTLHVFYRFLVGILMPA